MGHVRKGDTFPPRVRAVCLHVCSRPTHTHTSKNWSVRGRGRALHSSSAQEKQTDVSAGLSEGERVTVTVKIKKGQTELQKKLHGVSVQREKTLV